MWLRILHLLRLTNLSDEQVEEFINKSKSNKQFYEKKYIIIPNIIVLFLFVGVVNVLYYVLTFWAQDIFLVRLIYHSINIFCICVFLRYVYVNRFYLI